MAATRTALVLIAAFGAMTAPMSCARFPQLEAVVTDEARTQPYPDLVPLEQLQSRIADNRVTPQAGAALEDRVARLEARAERLRGDVIDQRTRERMRAGVKG